MATFKELENEETVENKLLNFSLQSPHSLQDLSYLTICKHIWQYSSVKQSYHEMTAETYKGYCQKLNEKISELLQGLTLPVSLKPKIFCFLKDTGLQLYSWLMPEGSSHFANLKRRFSFEWRLQHLGELRWTSFGTLDEITQLELLCNAETSEEHVTKCFEAACELCLEDHISELWGALSEYARRNIKAEHAYSEYQDHFFAYWTLSFSDELNYLMNFIKPHDFNNLYEYNCTEYENMMTLSVFMRNLSAVKYFWSKLAKKQVEVNYVKLIRELNRAPGIKTDSYVAVLGFLLSKKIPFRQQNELFKNHIDKLMILARYWPWRNLLLKLLPDIQELIDPKMFAFNMLSLMNAVTHNNVTHNYLEEVWSNVSDNLRKDVIPILVRMRFCRDAELLLEWIASIDQQI